MDAPNYSGAFLAAFIAGIVTALLLLGLGWLVWWVLHHLVWVG